MGLSFAEPTLVSIARALRTRMSDEGLDVEDIARSGLGYANLLYTRLSWPNWKPHAGPT
ncbi:hypothetical protein [Streptomyces sp. NPDC003877]